MIAEFHHLSTLQVTGIHTKYSQSSTDTIRAFSSPMRFPGPISLCVKKEISDRGSKRKPAIILVAKFVRSDKPSTDAVPWRVVVPKGVTISIAVPSACRALLPHFRTSPGWNQSETCAGQPQLRLTRSGFSPTSIDNSEMEMFPFIFGLN